MAMRGHGGLGFVVFVWRLLFFGLRVVVVVDLFDVETGTNEKGTRECNALQFNENGRLVEIMGKDMDGRMCRSWPFP